MPSTVLSMHGVRHHDHVVLRAAERLDALAGLGRALVDELRDRRGPDEGDRVDARMVEQRLDDLAAAVDQVDDAVREAEPVDDVEGDLLRERHLLRRLEHERVPAPDREREEPERHHRREVERDDRGAHADGLADRLGVDVARDVLERCAPASSSGSRRRPRPSRPCARPRRARRSASCPSPWSPSGRARPRACRAPRAARTGSGRGRSWRRRATPAARRARPARPRRPRRAAHGHAGEHLPGGGIGDVERPRRPARASRRRRRSCRAGGWRSARSCRPRYRARGPPRRRILPRRLLRAGVAERLAQARDLRAQLARARPRAGRAGRRRPAPAAGAGGGGGASGLGAGAAARCSTAGGPSAASSDSRWR